jgi:hypothetical protein
MQIKIAERLKPYTHLPGTSCLLPGSSYQIQVFPALIRFFDLSASPQLLDEIAFDFQGPLKDFTAQNDLEKGEVRVWGECPSGFVRYSLNSCAKGGGVRLTFDKTPPGGIRVSSQTINLIAQAKESISLFDLEPIEESSLYRPPSIDRLSLGNHKAQDCELIRRRLDLAEIFPIWHRLGQLVVAPAYHDEAEGTLALIQACQNGLSQGKPEHLAQLWVNLYLAGFHGMMAPRLWDDQYQGIIPNQGPMESSLSPLILLTQAACLIRQHFIQKTEAGIKILPMLPPEFHSGRLLGVQLEDAVVSLEWTKKIIRRLEAEINRDAEMIFHFRHVKRCRLRKSKGGKGVWIESGKPVLLEKNHHYFFDNFS